MAIIAISGKAQAGKDTVGEMLRELLSNKCVEKNSQYFEIRKFADKLKNSIQFKFPYLFNTEKWEDGGNLYRNEYLPLLKMTRRELLIKEAMALRDINKDYWIAALLQDYKIETKVWNSLGESRLDDYSNWIITDLRFQNEFKAIYSLGGICIRVERELAAKIDSVSETDLDDCLMFHYTIHNNGSYSDLINQVRVIYLDIINKEKIKTTNNEKAN